MKLVSWVEFVWRLEADGAAAEHHERECRVGGVEAVGASGDEADFVVQRLGAALVDPEPDCVKDPVAVTADRLAEADERLQPAAGGFAEEPIDEYADVLDGQLLSAV